MNVAFDSRPAKSTHGVGRYARCLLQALRDLRAVRGRRDPPAAPLRRVPLARGSTARCCAVRCRWSSPLHDLAPLKRHGQYLRSTLRFKLRYLAVQRAARVIVPTCAVAEDVEARARDPPRAHRGDPRGRRRRRCIARSEEEVSAVRHRF